MWQVKFEITQYDFNISSYTTETKLIASFPTAQPGLIKQNKNRIIITFILLWENAS